MTSSTFDKIYEDFISQIEELDLAGRAEVLGCEYRDQSLIVPLYHRKFFISAGAISGPSGQKPLHAEIVILHKYVLFCPEHHTYSSKWLSFKDFKDAAPFVGAFSKNVEKAIADNFQGRLEDLRRACQKLQGFAPEMNLSYELAVQFHALPRVDVLLLFNDADEEFPSDCKVLFADNITDYLDMESLAMLGWLLSDYLYLEAGGLRHSIM